MTIILIGMPGSGKTTVGKEIAKVLNVPVIDTDALIIEQTGKSIKELLDQDFTDIETRAILSIPLEFNGIISTGGSVIYSNAAMKHLKKIGPVIYLYVTLDTLNERVTNFSERGIVIKEGMTFEDLYNERCPIYERWADFSILNDELGNTVERLQTAEW